MLQALLGSAGLTTDDVQIVEYPDFTQRAAVEQGAVDAATGFANNEPVQLELDGVKPVVLAHRRHHAAAGPGPHRRRRARSRPSTTRSPRSWRPRCGRWRRSRRTRPSGWMPRSPRSPSWPRRATRRPPILAATIATWAGPVQVAHGLGAIDRDGWTTSIAYLGTLGLVKNPVTTDDLVREDLLPAGD